MLHQCKVEALKQHNVLIKKTMWVHYIQSTSGNKMGGEREKNHVEAEIRKNAMSKKENHPVFFIYCSQ